jgi:hypothetical protein
VNIPRGRLCLFCPSGFSSERRNIVLAMLNNENISWALSHLIRAWVSPIMPGTPAVELTVCYGAKAMDVPGEAKSLEAFGTLWKNLLHIPVEVFDRVDPFK